MSRKFPNPPPYKEGETYVRPAPPPMPPMMPVPPETKHIKDHSNIDSFFGGLFSNKKGNKMKDENFYVTLDFDCPDWKSPNWVQGGKVHNWHNYASKEMQRMWNTFTDDQKQVIALTLNEIADNEHWD